MIRKKVIGREMIIARQTRVVSEKLERLDEKILNQKDMSAMAEVTHFVMADIGCRLVSWLAMDPSDLDIKIIRGLNKMISPLGITIARTIL